MTYGDTGVHHPHHVAGTNKRMTRATDTPAC
jgi:hypothetical protein